MEDEAEFLDSSSEQESSKITLSFYNSASNPPSSVSNTWSIYDLFKSIVFPSTYLIGNCYPVQNINKSPYDNFNGSFPFVITVIGPPRVGKSSFCDSLKSIFAASKNKFRYSSIPPDVRISVPIEDLQINGMITSFSSLEKNQDSIDLGIYDSLGFDNPSLVQYLLEPQIPASNLDKFIISGAENKVKTSSEGFLVFFDVSNTTSFHLACQFIDQIFEFFSFHPQNIIKDYEERFTNFVLPSQSEESPVVIFLIGNKIDKKNVVDTQVKMLLNSPIGGFISYFETSLQDKEGQKLIIEKIALKIQKQRDLYYEKKVKNQGIFS